MLQYKTRPLQLPMNNFSVWNRGSLLAPLASMVFAFSHGAGFNFNETRPDWKTASAAQLTEALEQFTNDDGPRALPAIEAMIDELRRRIALHGPEEPRSTALLIDALMAKVYNQRASHFANRTQSTDEATEYQNGLPAYREADRILSEALSKFPNDVHVLRRVLSNSLPSTRDLQVKFVILKRLVIADKTNFVAHISLVRVAMLIGDMSTARGASINMLRRMLLLGDADLPLVPFDVTVGNLSGDFRDEGGACPDLSNALGADFALMPQQFHTRPDSAVGPEHFKDAADRTAKLTSLREMLKKMIDNFSTSTCGAHR